MVLSTHNSLLSTGIKRLYRLHTSPVVLCKQNSEFRSTFTSFCGSKTPHVVFACKTATSGPELQVSMGPRHDLSFCACTRACLASELLVSLGPSTHLWFLHAKQRFWTRITSLCVYQTSPVALCMQISVISTRITGLSGFQPSSVVFACKTASFLFE